jgi:hypothetical protein
MTAAHTRLIGYFAAVALGIFMTVWGILHGDWALITAGLGLVTTGSVAGANVPRAEHAAIAEAPEPAELRRSARVRGDHAAE